MNESSASGTRPGEGAISFSHSGYGYILGYGHDYFGIWEREKPGGPVVRFPRTDEGWNQAWNTFVAWEPSNVEVPRAGIPPDARTYGKPFRSAHTLARWTVGLVSGTVGLGVLSIVAWAIHIGVLSRFGAGEFSAEALEASEVRSGVVTFLMLASFLAAGIVWLLWQYRAQSNLSALGAADLRYSPGWAVGWWFIPFANIVMPYLTMRELWKASDPDAGAIEWKTARGTPMLPVWWGTWLGMQIAAQIGSAVTENPDVRSQIAASGWLIAFVALFVAAGVLAVAIVRRIDLRQGQKHAQVVARSRAVAAMS
ncbi:MAG: DUF4328 domain-containing protein [Actinomycetota bacterium]|nr:DUF4328 domain-containing protein [Actinomycetota bacterium]